MLKKVTRLQINDITENKKHLGERKLSEAELKLVAGGAPSEGGTCSDSGDCDA